MLRSVRSVLAATAVVGALLSVSATGVEAQQAPAPIDAAWAEQFHGDWKLSMETPGGAQTMVLAVAPAESGLSVRINSEGGMPAPTLSSVSRNEETLVARFVLAFDGGEFPMTINMKRDGEALVTQWVMGDGEFQMEARGTKQ